ncbi:MAG TPA: tetratricopeptide repeat protein [Anaerolineaceae bacterium]
MAGNLETFQQAMNQGHSAAWDQDWEKAAAYYRMALEEFPDNFLALSSLGLALFELQDYSSALQIYKSAASQAPNDPIPAEKMGRIYERQGNLKEAVQSFLLAADLNLKARNVEKAVESWQRVVSLDPENMIAHSRLAGVFERLARKTEAVAEYLAAAAILQDKGDIARALQVVEYALKLAPDSRDAAMALNMIRSNKPLPKPVRSRRGSGPLRMAEVRQLEKSKENGLESLDPIAEARQKALTQLASLLFDQSEEQSPIAAARRGLISLARGEKDSNEPGDNPRVTLYLGQAIEAQTHEDVAKAAEDLEKAVDAGLRHSSAYYDLGLLLVEKKPDKALKYLGEVVKDPDYALAAHLLSGSILLKKEKISEALRSFLLAFSIADSETVPVDLADDVRQLYEPVIESQKVNVDIAGQKKLCEELYRQLYRPDWRRYLLLARQQLPSHGLLPQPLINLFFDSSGPQVVEYLGHIRDLVNRGLYRTAMEEAYHALSYAATYLPLHIQIAEILVQQGKVTEAVEKFKVIAALYDIRGEALQSTRIMKRALELAPSDINLRTKLIDILESQGKYEDALQQYLELGDFYYLMADLSSARATYLGALSAAQSTRSDRASWQAKLLNKVADIDLQRLNLRSALKIFEQVRTIQPENQAARREIIELNYRLEQVGAAQAELDSYLVYLEGAGKRHQAIQFVVDLLNDEPDRLELYESLAGLYARARQLEKAVEVLDGAADAYMQKGDVTSAIRVLQEIIRLNPPNVNDYRNALAKIRPG